MIGALRDGFGALQFLLPTRPTSWQVPGLEEIAAAHSRKLSSTELLQQRAGWCASERQNTLRARVTTLGWHQALRNGQHCRCDEQQSARTAQAAPPGRDRLPPLPAAAAGRRPPAVAAQHQARGLSGCPQERVRSTAAGGCCKCEPGPSSSRGCRAAASRGRRAARWAAGGHSRGQGSAGSAQVLQGIHLSTAAKCLPLPADLFSILNGCVSTARREQGVRAHSLAPAALQPVGQQWV